jgi:hypothetical protein
MCLYEPCKACVDWSLGEVIATVYNHSLRNVSVYSRVFGYEYGDCVLLPLIQEVLVILFEGLHFL